VKTLLEEQLERMGDTMADVPSARTFLSTAVRDTPEFQRVKFLPYRDWQISIGKDRPEVVAQLLTQVFRRDGGTMSLRPVQAAALAELADYGGVFCTAPVGSGKALISMLAPAVLEAQRPLLLIPAKLRRATERVWLDMSKHWKLPRTRVESYEMLGRVQAAEYLNNYRPDLIVSDEAHHCKNLKASSVRRLKRYIKENPTCRFVALSGTITNRTLHEYWHILAWCLRNHMPLPREWKEMCEWADAVDVKRDGDRIAPGALLQICTPTERAEIEAVSKIDPDRATSILRLAYQRRLTGTPGVVSLFSQSVACSLSVEEKLIDLSHLEPYYQQLRTNWETPGGEPFEEAVEMWRHARELACGFYQIWDPPAPKDWLAARRAWSAFVRDVLGNPYSGCDSPLQVANAVVSGRISDQGQYAAWSAVRKTFKPNPVPVWIDDATLRVTADWLFAKGEPPGIAWVEHVPFGQRLSQMTGIPYFGAGGVDAEGRMIEDCRGPCIASIAANATGRNLQHFSRNLMVSILPSGKIWEQVLGRTHRSGQDADEVTAEVLFGCWEQWIGFQHALGDARYIQETTGQPQKLLNCDLTVMSDDEVRRQTGALWR
jgi:hypothetical protein